MTEIKTQLHSLLDAIKNAMNNAQRQQQSVQLLAVSKTWPAERLRKVADAGQRCFGENYLQEALTKMSALADLDLEWHFIGPIQSNKTRDIAAHFDWVQSIDRVKIARRLSEQRPTQLAPLNICIQVNIDNEASKSGVKLDDVLDLAKQLSQFKNLQLRGLMIIPQKTDNPQLQRHSFQKAQQLFSQLAALYSSVDTLSMGMSNDMELAIAEGSTMVRIGTALFGQRNPPHASK
ncbi:MAG: YggS family pyridoxal phosphate-dependent enzyme [Gammaproteobacteria bacterium]|nr:YggS family pyridoxal phosphate-dependent enzyme [Gammaproteobacteria bacterium]